MLRYLQYFRRSENAVPEGEPGHPKIIPAASTLTGIRASRDDKAQAAPTVTTTHSRRSTGKTVHVASNGCPI